VLVPTQDDLVAAVRAAGIHDVRVLEAVAAVPRAAFVPPGLEPRAYVDEPLPIPHDQVTTQPSLSAKMIEALALSGDEQVLEVGTGFGFQTALLACITRFVWTVERWPDIAGTARANLRGQGVENVEVVVTDGSAGLQERAPFDAVLVSAAFPRVPDPLRAQLREGGRLVQPIGTGGNEDVVLFERVGKDLVPIRSVTGAHFVRLVGSHAFRR
jgi:protein-L-isoaspartate(D-aspartate) O-methyltransferase